MSRRFLNFPLKRLEMSQSCDISRMGQEHRKGGARANFRGNADKAPLPGDNLTCKIQADPNAGGVMYPVLTVEPLENRPLMLFWNTNARIRNINLHIHFPAHHSHMDFPAIWRVLHRIIQNVEQGFGCPFPIMGRSYCFRAIYRDRNLFRLLPGCGYRNPRSSDFPVTSSREEEALSA